MWVRNKRSADERPGGCVLTISGRTQKKFTSVTLKGSSGSGTGRRVSTTVDIWTRKHVKYKWKVKLESETLTAPNYYIKRVRIRVKASGRPRPCTRSVEAPRLTQRQGYQRLPTETPATHKREEQKSLVRCSVKSQHLQSWVWAWGHLELHSTTPS